MILSEKNVKIKDTLDDIIVNYEMFDYLDEIVKVNRERPHRHNKDTVSGAREMDKEWDGINSYKEAEGLAIHGWSEQDDNDELADLFRIQNTNDEDKLVQFKNDIVGYVPVVPLVLQGIPNSMINVVKKRVKSKIINLVYNISTTSGTNPNSILHAGLQLFKVIMKLERQGYRVRLTAMQDFTEDDNVDLMILNLKSEFQPLNVSSIMFPLLHPGMFRGIGFAWYERSPVTKEKYGYGTSFENRHHKSDALKMLKEILKTDNIKYIWYNEIANKNAEEILKMIV